MCCTRTRSWRATSGATSSASAWPWCSDSGRSSAGCSWSPSPTAPATRSTPPSSSCAVRHRSDRCDAVPPAGERPVLGPVRRQPSDELGPQVLRLDDRIDDELAGKPDDVDVGVVLVAQLLDERGPLALVVDRLDPVVVDGVDGGLRTH